MIMSGLKVFVAGSSGWGPAEWISLVIACTTLAAVYFGYRQGVGARLDNDKSHNLLVRQVNREGLIRIYANSLGALRGTLADLTTNIIGVEIREVPTGKTRSDGQPELVTRIWMDEANGEGSLNRVRHPVINEFMTAEHKAQMDLLGSEDLVRRIGEWLVSFNKIKVEFENRMTFLNKQIMNGEISKQDLRIQMDEAKAKAVLGLDPVEDEVKAIQVTMKEELTIG